MAKKAVAHLNHGKSDGDSLSSDHNIISAPFSTCTFLAHLFTKILKHGFMPLSLRDATFQLIPKGSKDPSLSANYRGIALASSLIKVLEWSILLTWGRYFTQVTCSLDSSLVTLPLFAYPILYEVKGNAHTSHTLVITMVQVSTAVHQVDV